VLPALLAWFRAEWPAYYGAGGRGRAWRDLQAYANADRLPFGVVALRAGVVCGIAALKADSIATHAHLSPWAAAGLVRRDLRGQGIGGQLLRALEERAKVMGFPRIYCGTGTARALLVRSRWTLREQLMHDGEMLGIYEKLL
jgi:GNAT superfamily N-acetyltransferase